ncbi:MAG: hypothetical protein LBC96_07340 [Lachnospiraceae bacterium]|jgi:hypothetical protein|nr:hypothetical protein [Lachnospiraceae bacterium]
MKKGLFRTTIKKKKHVIIALFVLLISALVVFSIYNYKWYRLVSIYEEFLYSEKLQDIKHMPTTAPATIVIGSKEFPYNYSRYTFSEGNEGIFSWKQHSFRKYDYNEYGYYFGITIPAYLQFGGNIQVVYENEDYRLDLLMSPVKWLYVLRIGEYEIVNNSKFIHMLSSAVDKTGTPIGRHPDDSEDFYESWLLLYDKYHLEIIDLFETTKDIYGDLLQ